jgi:hypothetical protein
LFDVISRCFKVLVYNVLAVFLILQFFEGKKKNRIFKLNEQKVVIYNNITLSLPDIKNNNYQQ